VKIVRAIECRTTPWKNGGGSTIEIAVEPPVASLDQFDWRVSMARVASDGPFSEFADVDRTLAVIKGSGLALTIGNAAAVVLDCNSDSIRFAGGTPTSARLLSGEIIDLNVMTRRGRFEHRLLRLREPAECDFGDHSTALVVAPSGGVSLVSPQGQVALARGDAAILTRDGDAPCRIAPAVEVQCYLVLLRKN
jgi:hypothetical protein